MTASLTQSTPHRNGDEQADAVRRPDKPVDLSAGHKSAAVPQHQSSPVAPVTADGPFLHEAIAWPDSPGDVRWFRTSDGYRLYYRYWSPAGAANRGRIVCLHGIQSHSGWYGYTAALLADAGFEVLFLDRRGSGLNLAQRGHAPAAERLVNDVLHLIRGLSAVCDNSSGPRLCLLGLSWGARLAVAVARQIPEMLEALVLQYPGIHTHVQPRLHQRWLLRQASRWGVDTKPVPVPLAEPSLFTAEPSWQAFIRNDPLALHTVTTGFLSASEGLAAAAKRDRSFFPCPTLLMQAGKDSIVNNGATRRWFEERAPEGSQIVEYADARHTLEFEQRRDAIVDDLIRWLLRTSEKNSGD